MWNTTDQKVSLEETSPLLRSQGTRTGRAPTQRIIMGNEAEAGHGTKGDEVPPDYNDARRDSVAPGFDDVAIIPKGVLDPVYEAKARVINHAVSSP